MDFQKTLKFPYLRLFKQKQANQIIIDQYLSSSLRALKNATEKYRQAINLHQHQYLFRQKANKKLTIQMPPKKKDQDESMAKDNHERSADVTKMSLMPVALIGGSDENIVPESKSEYEKSDYMGVNQVLVYNFKGSRPTYYVPAYLRMRINRVNQINYIESKAQIQTQIRIWLMIKDFPKVVQDEIINQTKLDINSGTTVQLEDIREPAKLDQSQIRNTSKFAVGFLLSQQMELNIESNAFWSPFELIKLLANLEIKKITLGNGNQKFEEDLSTNKLKEDFLGASVEFNFLDAHPFLQFSFGQVRSLGSFDIAESLVDMKFSNDSIRDDDEGDGQEDKQEGDDENEHLNLIGQALQLRQKLKQEKFASGQISPDAYEHGQILIPLYKYPSTTIINVFVPLYMVAAMSCGVFFEANDMSNRDASLATFLLAYIAFLPTIRENLPETPKIVFTEILVYMQITCSIICFAHSIYVNQDDTYVFTWSQNVPFLVVLSLTILNITIVLGMFIIHKTVWERNYNKLPKGSKKYMGMKSLNTDDNEEWWNRPCEEEFAQAMKAGVVKPYVLKKKKKKKIPKNIMDALFGALGADQNSQNSENLGDQSKVHPVNE